jgi:hypothetical protein
MRAQQPRMGISRTLYGQKTLPGADRPQAPVGGGQALCRGDGSGGSQGTGHKRSHLPPLEEPLRWDELQRGKTPQGVGEGERSPQEASRREGAGHRHPQGGEPKKLLSPSRRRKAVKHIKKKFGLSERRACRTVGQPKSTQRYPSRKADWDRPLIERMIMLSKENPRYGYRRAWALLRRAGCVPPQRPSGGASTPSSGAHGCHPQPSFYIANLLRAQGSYEEARPLYERALAIRENTAEPNNARYSAEGDK